MMSESKRNTRIITLLDRISNGKQVSRSSMVRLFGEHHMTLVDKRIQDEKKSGAGKPDKIVNYATKLEVATKLNSKADKLLYKGDFAKAKKCREVSESELESSQEYLKDAVISDPNLMMWIDRHPFNVQNLSFEDVPRPVWSTSRHKISGACTRRSLRQEVYYEILEREVSPPAETEITCSLEAGRSRMKKHDFSGFKF
jgi:hypothetical protein